MDSICRRTFSDAKRSSERCLATTRRAKRTVRPNMAPSNFQKRCSSIRLERQLEREDFFFLFSAINCQGVSFYTVTAQLLSLTKNSNGAACISPTAKNLNMCVCYTHIFGKTHSICTLTSYGPLCWSWYN